MCSKSCERSQIEKKMSQAILKIVFLFVAKTFVHINNQLWQFDGFQSYRAGHNSMTTTAFDVNDVRTLAVMSTLMKSYATQCTGFSNQHKLAEHQIQNFFPAPAFRITLHHRKFFWGLWTRVGCLFLYWDTSGSIASATLNASLNHMLTTFLTQNCLPLTM